jgi:hypothetical protein
MHSKNFVHGNIQPINIVYLLNGTIKLSGLGCVNGPPMFRQLGDGECNYYLSPERIQLLFQPDNNQENMDCVFKESFDYKLDV